MFLDWLLKTEEDNISYDELKNWHKTDQDGVSEDGNLPYGQNTTAAACFIIQLWCCKTNKLRMYGKPRRQNAIIATQ